MPSTDPKLLAGRMIEVSLSDMGGDPRQPTRLFFKINSVTERKAHTIFGGFSLAREYVARMSRKRNDKVDLTLNVTTKDGWQLHIGCLLITNRNCYNKIKTVLRHLTEDKIKEAAGSMNIDEFVMSLIERRVQNEIRAAGNKHYPLRFSEVTKVEIIKQPNN